MTDSTATARTRMNLRQRVFLALVIVANAAIWMVPSDVTRLIIRDKPVLLGRYSREHFIWILAVAAISIIGLYIDQARSRATYRRRWMQVIATLIALAPALLALDWALRYTIKPRYVRDSLAYHRPPRAHFIQRFHDNPATNLVIAGAPEGYPEIECHYSADARGYRNQHGIGRCQIITLGDSFTEGCNVSDEHAWPALLARRSGQSVYNLGMTGYSPMHYAASLAEHGPQIAPQTVICMVYEGNDFHITDEEMERDVTGLGRRISRYFKRSPIRLGIDGVLIGVLGQVPVQPDPRLGELLDWLPLYIPDQQHGHPYVFAPKALLEHSQSETAFVKSKYWPRSKELLNQVADSCRKLSARLIVVYAPTKAHVILPLVRDRLPFEKVLGFASIGSSLPMTPAGFERMLFENLSARQRTVGQWCRQNGIEFVTLAEPLREAMANGMRVYFTYDHHWTPPGHELVARIIAGHLDLQSAPPELTGDPDSPLRP